MADNTSQIAGLFMTPEMYQQERQNQFVGRASQLAQLDPGALANFYAMTGGFGAGNVLAGALGVQDPMMQQLSAVNSVMKQTNPNDPSSLMEAAQRLSSVAPRQAAQLAQQALAAREKEATIQAKLAERLTPQQRNAAAKADNVATRGTPEWAQAYKTNLDELTSTEKTQVIEANGRSYLINKATGETIKDLGTAPFRGTNIGLTTVDKEANLRQNFTAETKPITTAITAADKIEKLLTTQTALGDIIAKKQFAKVAGDTNISNKDVAELANFGDLGQRLAGTLSGFFEGRYAPGQREEALNLVRQLKNDASSQYGSIQSQYRNRAVAENLPGKTAEFIAPDLPIKKSVSLPPEGTVLRNKKTGKLEVVKNGKIVPQE